ncbi:MAG: hypothetical protein NTZ93_05040 [Candidatus Beckwithbacteria bacterium]|nr:hypothetical protein [Candidatus Beckwithbacteria bacterium]
MSGKNGQEALTEEQVETSRARIGPFLNELFVVCFDLNLQKKLTVGKLNELASKHHLGDLTITPESLLPVITTVTAPLFKKGSTEEKRKAVAQRSGIDAEAILKLQQAVFFTEQHLLALSGQPLSVAFQKLYSSQFQA